MTEPKRGLLLTGVTGEEPKPPSEGFTALTEDERGAFEYLQAVVNGRLDSTRLALMRVRYRDEDRAVIVSVSEDEDAQMIVRPLAMMLDDDLFAELDPGDA